MTEHGQQSLRALDWLNFFMADVATGEGPFLAIYLTATRHWDPASVCLVVATQSIASVAAQAPAGWMVDWSEHKKWLIIGAAVPVAFGCVGIVLAPNKLRFSRRPLPLSHWASSAIKNFPHGLGVTKASTTPATSALRFCPVRSVLAWGQQWIFYSSAFVAIGTICAAAGIRPGDIDNVTARGASRVDKDGSSAHVASFRDLAGQKSIWVLTASVILFHFANAAMLPLVGELLSRGKTANPPCICRRALSRLNL